MSLSAAEILQANDSLTQVINLYRQLVKGEEVNGDTVNTARLPGTALTSAVRSLMPKDFKPHRNNHKALLKGCFTTGKMGFQ